MARIMADAMTALGSFGEALTGDLATGEDEQAFAIGEEQFNRRLHFEHAVNITAPELWRYGLRLVEEVEANLVRLAAEIDPGETWRGLIERFREESPVRGDRVEAYRAAMARARDFVQERGLVAIPPGDLEVLPMPAFLRPVTPFAAYWAPGRLRARPDRTVLRESGRRGLPGPVASTSWRAPPCTRAIPATTSMPSSCRPCPRRSVGWSGAP